MPLCPGRGCRGNKLLPKTAHIDLFSNLQRINRLFAVGLNHWIRGAGLKFFD